MKIHHAPWSRKWRTMWYKGTVAYELQLGSLVFQCFHTKPPSHIPRLHVWRDHYTNYPSYLRYALWGVA